MATNARRLIGFLVFILFCFFISIYIARYPYNRFIDYNTVNNICIGDDIHLVRDNFPLKSGDYSTQGCRLASNFILKKGSDVENGNTFYWIDDMYYFELQSNAEGKVNYIFLCRSNASFFDFIFKRNHE